MRMIIANGTVVTGDGKTILNDHSVVIEDGMIVDLMHQPFPPYDPAGEIIDAKGGLVIPGVINHHSHGGTVGPFNVFGENSLPTQRVLHNLNRHMLYGTTTVVNACGWPTMSEIEGINKIHPINVRASTLHLPTHLKHAQFVDGRGIKQWHETTTIQEMIQRGAVAIGEAGAPCAAYGTPQIVQELGAIVTVSQVQKLKEAALGPGVDPSAFDPEGVTTVLKESGLDGQLDPQGVRDLMDRHVVKPFQMTRDCVEELAHCSLEYDLPLLFHNTLDTKDLLLDLAPKLGGRLIALHTNYTYSPSEAITCARELKRYGAWVDVFTGDAFGTQLFHKSPEVSMALFREGLVDLVSTDYIAGYWDPILLVMEKAVEAGVITLPQAIRKTSSDVVEAIPRIGTDRGIIAPGKVADLAIVHPKRISEVRTVLVGGRKAVHEGKIAVDGTPI
jgi:hypothetical protein